MGDYCRGLTAHREHTERRVGAELPALLYVCVSGMLILNTFLTEKEADELGMKFVQGCPPTST